MTLTTLPQHEASDALPPAVEAVPSALVDPNALIIDLSDSAATLTLPEGSAINSVVPEAVTISNSTTRRARLGKALMRACVDVNNPEARAFRL